MTSRQLDEVEFWFDSMGRGMTKEVDRLWPEENDPVLRLAALVEEVGELSRALTKRRHAMHAKDGLCKGKTVEEWTAELAIEFSQVMGVLIDIGHREEVDMPGGVENCLVILQARKKGT